MKLGDARSAYYDRSADLSSNLRTACYAGIGVVWIFREIAADNGEQLGSGFRWALALFVTSLGLDLLQYALQTLFWGRYARAWELDRPFVGWWWPRNMTFGDWLPARPNPPSDDDEEAVSGEDEQHEAEATGAIRTTSHGRIAAGIESVNASIREANQLDAEPVGDDRTRHEPSGPEWTNRLAILLVVLKAAAGLVGFALLGASVYGSV